MTYKSIHVPVNKLDAFLEEFNHTVDLDDDDDDNHVVVRGKYAGWEIAFMFVELHQNPLVDQAPTPVYRCILKKA
jgi:hypothetical protein